VIERILKVVVTSAFGAWIIIVGYGLCFGVSVVKSPMETIALVSTIIIPSLSLLVAYQAWYSGAKTELLKRQMQDYSEMTKEICDLFDEFDQLFTSLPTLDIDKIQFKLDTIAVMLHRAIGNIFRRIFVPDSVRVPFAKVIETYTQGLGSICDALKEGKPSENPFKKGSEFRKSLTQFRSHVAKLSFLDTVNKEIQDIIMEKIDEEKLWQELEHLKTFRKSRTNQVSGQSTSKLGE
jgi:hypothetical protein